MGFFLQMHIWCIGHQYFEASFNMTFTRYFDDNVEVIYVCLFVASGRPFKISNFWKTQFQNACNWERLGDYFNIRNRLVWEFKLFVFHEIEMKLMHIIIACVFRSWNKINPFITKYSKNRQFWNSFNTVSEIPYLCYYLWNNEADVVISSFITSGPSSCIDDSDKSPSRRLVMRRRTRAWYTACKALCTAQRSCSAFRGRTAAALICRLI